MCRLAYGLWVLGNWWLGVRVVWYGAGRAGGIQFTYCATMAVWVWVDACFGFGSGGMRPGVVGWLVGNGCPWHEDAAVFPSLQAQDRHCCPGQEHKHKVRDMDGMGWPVAFRSLRWGVDG